jgi:hypothetical protein
MPASIIRPSAAIGALARLPYFRGKTNALTALAFGTLSRKYNSGRQFVPRSYPHPSRQGDSDRCCPFDCGNRGKTMRLDTVDYGSQSDERKPETNDDTQQNLLTPARRAALDALEREFHDLLKARPR